MQQLREGLQAVVQVPLLRLSMVLTTVVSFGQMMAFSVLVLFVLEKLHLSGSGYGILMAASAVGGILGGFVAPRLIRLYGYAVVLIAAIGFSGVTLGLLAFTSSAIVAGFLIGLQFICLVAGRVVLVGARQRKISRDLLGRVAGAQRTVMWCATAVGGLAGGFIGSRFGIRAPIALSGLLFLITAVAAGRAILQHFSEGADSSGS